MNNTREYKVVTSGIGTDRKTVLANATLKEAVDYIDEKARPVNGELTLGIGKLIIVGPDPTFEWVYAEWSYLFNRPVFLFYPEKPINESYRFDL